MNIIKNFGIITYRCSLFESCPKTYKYRSIGLDFMLNEEVFVGWLFQQVSFFQKTVLNILLRGTRVHGVSLAADGAAVTNWTQP